MFSRELAADEIPEVQCLHICLSTCVCGLWSSTQPVHPPCSAESSKFSQRSSAAMQAHILAASWLQEGLTGCVCQGGCEPA